MNPIPFNAAEALLDAFYDQDTCGLPRWTVHPGGADGLRLLQFWDGVHFMWERAAPGAPALRMTRSFDAPCPDYDRVLLSIMAPAGAVVSLEAATDAGTRRADSPPFDGAKQEVCVGLEGARTLLSVTISVRSATRASEIGWLEWLGLQSSADLPR